MIKIKVSENGYTCYVYLCVYKAWRKSFGFRVILKLYSTRRRIIINNITLDFADRWLTQV